ncbi:hypothetical protein [Novipirellula rosea]|uniref:Transposase IS66 C-terminal domain-containing protein n=1 Tax=Novipirellula rosea TaxID=1031540 RepID=A0ABP8MBQ5_9BACT
MDAWNLNGVAFDQRKGFHGQTFECWKIQLAHKSSSRTFMLSRHPIDRGNLAFLRLVVTGQKNWLFKGSVFAGDRAANLMTVVGTAICNDLDVSAYLHEVLQRELDGETDWAGLAPYAWKVVAPEAIRTYRQDERCQSADRNLTRRARRRFTK